MKYADYTRNSKDPIKRLAHGTRLEQAAKVIDLKPEFKVLDYGCGDGGFFYNLEEFVPAHNLYGFDPGLLHELTFEGATTYEDADAVTANHPSFFDVIFCIEVCEHLNDEALFVLFKNIQSMAKKDAIIVFGVPIETGLSGFLKNIYRTVKGKRQGAGLSIAIQSLFGIYIQRVHSEKGWIGSHIGFDINFFTTRLGYGGFVEIDNQCLPYPIFGKYLNNEKYFICKSTQNKSQ